MAGNKNCGRKKNLGSDVIVINIEATIVDDVDDVDDVDQVDDVVVAAAVVDYFYGPVISGSGSEQQRSQKAHY